MSLGEVFSSFQVTSLSRLLRPFLLLVLKVLCPSSSCFSTSGRLGQVVTISPGTPFHDNR